MPENLTILITGASGLIGTALSEQLSAEGHTVIHLGRRKNASAKFQSYEWNIDRQTIEQEAVDRADVIIHLAGAGITDKRWSDERKKEIIASRVESARLLSTAVAKRKNPLPLFISASGIGWYGMVTEEKIFEETDPVAKDFPAECCRLWEESAERVEAARRVVFRIGVVFSEKGGALPQLSKPVKLFVGSALASGKQWIPWIHIDDICAMFSFAISHEKISGVYNAVAPEPVQHKTLVKLIGKIIHRPVFMPAVPRFVLKLILGEMQAIVTEGSRVSCRKISDAGFRFHYVSAEAAVKDLLGR